MIRRMILCIAILSTVAGFAASNASSTNSVAQKAIGGTYGALFVMTNANDPIRGNEVVMYNRAPDGSLSIQGRFPTGGFGSGPGIELRGDGLASHDCLVANQREDYLLGVNFASHTISVFRISPLGLVRTDVEPSGGLLPVSITVQGDLVYVLNSGDEGAIAGFRLSREGILVPIPGSIRSVNAGGAPGTIPFAFDSPTQVRLSPRGDLLSVITKDGFPGGVGRLDMYTIDRRTGAPSAEPVRNASNGPVPWGGFFDDRGHFYVAEAFGGPNMESSAISSYDVGRDGTLRLITGSVATNNGGTCWLVGNAGLIYTSNFLTYTCTSLSYDRDGNVALIDSTAGVSQDEARNLDMAVTRDGRYVYILLPGAGSVQAWRTDGAGGLTDLGEFGGFERAPDVNPTEPFQTTGGSAAGTVSVDFFEFELGDGVPVFLNRHRK